jgi:hypothetical protein
LYQFAGWGADTIAGIEFNGWCNQLVGCTQTYKPVLVEDGDKVVPVPSALSVDPSSPNTFRYWINLPQVQSLFKDYDHGSLFEIPEVLSNIKSMIADDQVIVSSVINSKSPEPRNSQKKLRFFLHSPLTLGIYDNNGNYTGLNKDGSVSLDVEGSDYGTFGETQYLTVPGDAEYTLNLNGLDEGIFTLEMEEITDGLTSASTTFVGIPTTSETLVTMQISKGVYENSTLNVDEDGDGTTDNQISTEDDVYFYEEPLSTESTSSGSSDNTTDGFVLGTSTQATAGILGAPVEILKSFTSFPKLQIATVDVRSEDSTETVQYSQQEPKVSLLAIVYNLLSGFVMLLLRLFGINT